jgi:hypothetical protein
MTNEDAPRVQKSACPALARKNKGPEMTEEIANFKFVIKLGENNDEQLPVGELEDHGRGFSDPSARSGSS